MKIIKICILLLLSVLCLSACSSQIEEDITGVKTTPAPSSAENSALPEPAQNTVPDFNIELAADRISIEECREHFEAYAAQVREGSYGSLSFSDCEMIPIGEDVEKVGIYRLYGGEMGADESIETIKNWLKDIGREDTDIEKELRDASGQYDDPESRESGTYPYNYPSVFEHYPDFDSGHGFFINTNKCYIQMGYSGIYSMSDGSITSFLGLEGFAAMDALGANSEDVADSGSVTEKRDDMWELADGEMSVGDAAELVSNYFEAGTPRQIPEEIKVDAPYVRVFKLGDKYGYDFNVRRILNGVPFAYASPGGRTYYNSRYEIDEDMKNAYLINHDTVAAFTGYNDSELIEKLMEEQTEIISLKNASDILDEFFARNVDMEVKRTELVYCTFVDEEGNRTARPCWQFKGVNATNSQALMVYVNALSGETDYYSYREGD